MSERKGGMTVSLLVLSALAGGFFGAGIRFVPVPAPDVADVRGTATERTEPAEGGESGTIVRYGTLRTFSSGGGLSFGYVGNGELRERGADVSRNMFFASFPTRTQEDLAALDGRLSMFLDEGDGERIYEIVGTRLPDDCGYYEDVCLESMMIRSIRPLSE